VSQGGQQGGRTLALEVEHSVHDYMAKTSIRFITIK
jgi:hypothetical protein